MSQLVNGKRRYPSAGTRAKLLKGLGVDFEEIFEIEIPPGPGLDENSTRTGGTIPRHRPAAAQVEIKISKGSSDMNTWTQELLVAFRVFRRSPSFALVVTLVLALAIGANGALFSVLDAVVLQPLPYPDSERLFVLFQSDRHRGTQREGFSVPDLLDLRERSETFRMTSGIRFGNMTLTDSGDPIRLPTEFVTENHFSVLGVQAILGRGFGPGDSRPGQNRLVLISESLWIERFGRSSTATSNEITLDGVPHRIIGVMPTHAVIGGGNGDRIWVPLELDPERWLRGMHVLSSFARLAPGVTLERAQEELDTVMSQLEIEFAEDNAARGGWLASVHGEIVRNVEDALWMLLAAVVCVLLIGCVNVANLFLSRLNSRRSELALRAALGAGRWGLIRKILTEGLVLTLVGCGLGLGVAWLGVRTLISLAPASLPRTSAITMNSKMFLFSLGITLLAWLLVSLIPALRFSSAQLVDSLKEGGRQGGSAIPHSWLRNAFVVAQVGLAIMLVIGAGLLMRSFWELTRVDLGIETENVLSMNMELPQTQYPFPEGWPFLKWPAVTQLQDGLVQSIGSIPGVISVAFSISNPLASGWTTRVAIEGHPQLATDQHEEAYFLPVTEAFFETLSLPLLQGRVFQETDDDAHPLTAVVNQAFSSFYFPDGADPTGERVLVYGQAREIVGVAGDVRFRGLSNESYPAVYLPARQNPINSLTLVVKTQSEPMQLLSQIRQAAWREDPNLAFFGVTTLEEFLGSSLAQSRFTFLLLTLFAASALLLAMLGIYGVVSYLVAERTQEIGVRMALGAGTREVMGLVVGKGMVSVALGAVLGVLAAWAASRWLGSLLFQVDDHDPLTFVVVPLLLLLVGATACYLPARSAAQLDPTEALRGK